MSENACAIANGEFGANNKVASGIRPQAVARTGVHLGLIDGSHNGRS
jgi:hypothetical protein